MSEIDYKAKYEALVHRLQNDEGQGVHPLGHMKAEDRDGPEIKRTDAYKCGWNDCLLDHIRRQGEIIERAAEGLSDDMMMLLASGHVFLGEDGSISLNMNDTWSWATAWCPVVPASEVSEAARLFRAYGFAGLMYWHSRQEKDMRSEFHDNNRAIDFVRHEERIREEMPDSSKRAYRKASYTLGEG